MKKITTLLVVIFLFVTTYRVNAQQWMKSVKTDHPTFFEIQKAFNDYFKENPEEENARKEKDGDVEKYKRWEWYWEQRVSATGEFQSSDIIWKEWKKYVASHPTAKEKNQKSITNTGNWTFIGPNTNSNLTNYVGIGRVSCIGFHPTDPNTFWVGTPAGGLWKTMDAGATWSTNTDNLPVLGISDIAIDPTNPNNMYVATGDGDASQSLSNGSNGNGDTKSIGILNSTDGGNTWAFTSMNWNVTSEKLIRRLIINPTNPSILLAAASDGIWRTTDGGVTWTNETAGSGFYFMDLQFNPVNPNIVYAASAGNAQIFTSNDGGVNWTQVTTFTGIIRIKLAVSPAWADEVDALCSNSNDGMDGLYYSANDGASFAEYFPANCSNNLLGRTYPLSTSTCDGQGHYDIAYAINPSDESQFFLGGVYTWSSLDSGSLWYPNNYWVSSVVSVPTVHADKHFLAFHPLNNSYVFEGNDGGVDYTNDGGTTWNNISNGLEISEIYRICPSQTVANKIICGLQDNGTKGLNGGTWYDLEGGDGTNCLIDYTNSNIEYAAYVQGLIYKTTDGWNTQTTISTNIPLLPSELQSTGDPKGAWVTPYVLHPTNPNILFAGYKRLYETPDQGNTWSAISPQLTSDNLRSIAIAPSNPSTIYTASLDTLYITHNGGTTWSYNPLGIANTKITYLAVNPTNSQVVWMTLSGYMSGQKVYQSIDGGVTWTNVSGTLPNLPVNCIVYQTGSNVGLYIGTDVGVFYRDATLSDWIQYNTGLPNVVVNDLQISYNNNKLWAGTFGRGLWNSDLYTTTVGVSQVPNFNSTISIYPNPFTNQTTISFSEEQYNTTIKIMDVVGKEIKTISFTGKLCVIEKGTMQSGIYFVQITDENKNVVNRKIVVV